MQFPVRRLSKEKILEFVAYLQQKIVWEAAEIICVPRTLSARNGEKCVFSLHECNKFLVAIFSIIW